jgi:hypothetical protein
MLNEASVVWWIASFCGLIWWPGMFLALYRKKTSYEHSVFSWAIGTVGQTLFTISGWMYGESTLFWTMLGYLVLHVVMLSMVLYYRRNSNVGKGSASVFTAASPR